MRKHRLDNDPDLDASRLGSGSFAGDSSGLDDTGLDDTVADVEVEDALTDVSSTADDDGDRAGAVDEDDPGFDPEAGRGAIANKTSLSGAVLNESGLFVLGAIAALGGLTSVIFAVAMQSRPYIIAALVIAPATFVWFAFRWKKWLGRAPYLYRLLSTLNEKEDADAILESHLHRKEQKIRSKIARMEAEQGLSEGGESRSAH